MHLYRQSDYKPQHLAVKTTCTFSTLLTSNEGLVTGSATDLSHTAKPHRLSKLPQIKGHVLKQPRLSAFECCICYWVP